MADGSNAALFLFVCSAAWKIIKAWLPAAAVKKIKFLTKSNMGHRLLFFIKLFLLNDVESVMFVALYL